MFHPTRGGTRGGKDQFSWDDVKTDKDRECYLGHSVMAPVGRWQEGKDLSWYARGDDKSVMQSKLTSEFDQAKQMEERALMAALGYRVVEKPNTTHVKNEPVEMSKREQHSSESSSDEELMVKGQQIFYTKDTKELDRILLTILTKYKKKDVYKALGASSHGSHKSSKKHHKHKSSKRVKKEAH